MSSHSALIDSWRAGTKILNGLFIVGGILSTVLASSFVFSELIVVGRLILAWQWDSPHDGTNTSEATSKERGREQMANEGSGLYIRGTCVKLVAIGFSVIEDAVRDIAEYPPATRIVALLEKTSPQNQDVACRWFEIIAAYVAGRIWLSSSQCYLGGAPKGQFHSKLFVFVDSGPSANSPKQEPSVEEFSVAKKSRKESNKPLDLDEDDWEPPDDLQKPLDKILRQTTATRTPPVPPLDSSTPDVPPQHAVDNDDVGRQSRAPPSKGTSGARYLVSTVHQKILLLSHRVPKSEHQAAGPAPTFTLFISGNHPNAWQVNFQVGFLPTRSSAMLATTSNLSSVLKPHIILPKLVIIYSMTSINPPSTPTLKDEKQKIEKREGESCHSDGCAQQRASGTHPGFFDLSGVQLTIPVEFLSDCDLDHYVRWVSPAASAVLTTTQKPKLVLYALLIPDTLVSLSIASNHRLNTPAFKLLGFYTPKRLFFQSSSGGRTWPQRLEGGLHPNGTAQRHNDSPSAALPDKERSLDGLSGLGALSIIYHLPVSCFTGIRNPSLKEDVIMVILWPASWQSRRDLFLSCYQFRQTACQAEALSIDIKQLRRAVIASRQSRIAMPNMQNGNWEAFHAPKSKLLCDSQDPILPGRYYHCPTCRAFINDPPAEIPLLCDSDCDDV
ncbi:hypothetical protein F4604DRAFT_1687729 [Suillus subluteus]|nr:hypothetical protein F4604DRAFT_1687729 [Suillus subluteus]